MGRFLSRWAVFVGTGMLIAAQIYVGVLTQVSFISPDVLLMLTLAVLGGGFILSNIVFIGAEVFRAFSNQPSAIPYPAYRPTERSPSIPFRSSYTPIQRQQNRAVPIQSKASEKLNERYKVALKKINPSERDAIEQEAEDKGYLCALMFELMDEPCQAGSTQNWIERRYFNEAVERNGRNPMTNLPMAKSDVKIDRMKKDEISRFVVRVEKIASKQNHAAPVTTNTFTLFQNNPLSTRYEAALASLSDEGQSNFENKSYQNNYRSVIGQEIMQFPCKLQRVNMWAEAAELRDYVQKNHINPVTKQPMSLAEIKVDKVMQREIERFVVEIEREAKMEQAPKHATFRQAPQLIACTT